MHSLIIAAASAALSQGVAASLRQGMRGDATDCLGACLRHRCDKNCQFIPTLVTCYRRLWQKWARKFHLIEDTTY